MIHMTQSGHPHNAKFGLRSWCGPNGYTSLGYVRYYGISLTTDMTMIMTTITLAMRSDDNDIANEDNDNDNFDDNYAADSGVSMILYCYLNGGD